MPAIELVAEDDGEIVGLLDLEHGFEPGRCSRTGPAPAG